MPKKYLTKDGRGSRKATRRARPKPKPKGKQLLGYDVEVIYAGLSVKGYHKIRGKGMDAELKRIHAKYRADTSVAHVKVTKVY